METLLDVRPGRCVNSYGAKGPIAFIFRVKLSTQCTHNEDRGTRFLRNVGKILRLQSYTTTTVWSVRSERTAAR